MVSQTPNTRHVLDIHSIFAERLSGYDVPQAKTPHGVRMAVKLNVTMVCLKNLKHNIYEVLLLLSLGLKRGMRCLKIRQAIASFGEPAYTQASFVFWWLSSFKGPPWLLLRHVFWWSFRP